MNPSARTTLGLFTSIPTLLAVLSVLLLSIPVLATGPNGAAAPRLCDFDSLPGTTSNVETAIAEIQTLALTLNKPRENISEKIENAIGSLQHSLTMTGVEAMEDYEEAVRRLQQLNKKTKNLFQTPLCRVVQIAATAATDAYGLAILANPQSENVLRAANQISKASDDLADANFDAALDHYKKALKFALAALAE